MFEASNNSGMDDPTRSLPQQLIKLDFNINGVVVETNSTKLSTQIGELVRTNIPISYKSWKKVPKNYTDDVWNALLKKQHRDPTTPIPRTEVWLEIHKKKEGTIPEGVAPYMAAVMSIIESQSEVDSCSQSILDDPLSKVFGNDSKGRVRGVGTTVSRTQIESSAPSLAKIASLQSKNQKWKSHISRMDSTLQNVVMEMHEIKALYHGQTGTQGTTLCRAMTEGAFNSVLALTYAEMPCELLNWSSDVVATGRVFMDQTQGIGHGRVLKDTEQKVVLDRFSVPEENLYLGGQGGATNLEDISVGGVVVWPKIFIRYG